jgi:hypothetical protein
MFSSRVAVACAAALGGFVLLGNDGSVARASLVTMDFTDLTSAGVVSFNGSSFASTSAVDPFVVGGIGTVPNARFVIDSGFTETSTLVLDALAGPGADGVFGPGDTVITRLAGPSTFRILNASNQVVLSGSFSAGTFTSSVGGVGGTLSVASASLVLSRGPAFPPVASFDPDYSIAFALVGIPGGVSVTQTGTLAPGIFSGDLQPFAGAAGSINIAANINPIPEPSAALAMLAPALLATGRRRQG